MPRRGFTLLELIVVLAVLAVTGAMIMPRLRPNPHTQVDQWARLLAQDLDLARSRALATGAMTRVVVSDTGWTIFLDDNRDSVFAENVAERTALGPLNGRVLRDAVIPRRGVAGILRTAGLTAQPPGRGQRITFGPRGNTEPFGRATVVYLTHRTTPNAVRAVEINGAANVRVWKWQDRRWQ